MREYVTEAVVLDKEPSGEFDLRVTLLTEKNGRVVATMTSGRKITSKLAGHLEPTAFAQVRLTEQRTLHVTDALSISYPKLPLALTRLLSALTTPGRPDSYLWQVLKSGKVDGRTILKAFGFDPAEASCERCGLPPRLFLFRDALYYCETCVPLDSVYNSYLL